MEILLIILGAIGSAVLGFWISYLLQRLSYRDEYYKKVIDLRLKAYEDLDTFLNRNFRICFNDNGKKYLAFFDKVKEYKEFWVELATISHKLNWFGVKMSGKLLELGDNLNAKITATNDKDMREQGKQYFTLFDTFSDDLEEIMIDDISNMHYVGDFIEEKKQHYKQGKDNQNTR